MSKHIDYSSTALRAAWKSGMTTPRRTYSRPGSPVEWWIAAAAKVNRGWLPMPRHARGGRHASPATRNGRKVLAAVFSVAVA